MAAFFKFHSKLHGDAIVVNVDAIAAVRESGWYSQTWKDHATLYLRGGMQVVLEESVDDVLGMLGLDVLGMLGDL